MQTFQPDDYGVVIADLLRERRLAPLGPGQPNQAARDKLHALEVATAFAPQQVRDLDMARACLAGLWLYHDFLDESHSISQEISTPTGSYWHGLMHRREPDYSNAAYWFRRVGQHPVFDGLAEAAQELARVSAPDITVPWPWNPFWFIDLCKADTTGQEPEEPFARLVQKYEWELLFDYCYRQAIGVGGS